MIVDAKEVTFDYETVHTCDYPVKCKGNPSGECACGELAPFHGWWWEGEKKDRRFLCAEHLALILAKERQHRPDEDEVCRFQEEAAARDEANRELSNRFPIQF